MADNFQLDEIPIPRAAPVEAQLAPIVRGAEQQEQQAQGQVEQVPKAWGMRGAGFAGTGAGIANIAESILRGWLAGKATAAATMARQTVAEVSAAKQTDRENEQALANALQRTMDPTVAADPALKAKADAELATAQANRKSSWSTYRGILEKHALPEQAEQRAKQSRGVGGRIVHGMVGAFKAKDPTSAVLAAVYSGLPEEAPLPAIDPFAATKSRMLATAVKGGEQQLEAGKLGMEATRQQIKVGEQQLNLFTLQAGQAQKTAAAMDQYTTSMKQVQDLRTAGRADTDPEVRTAQTAANSAADLYAAYSGHEIPLPGTRQFELSKRTFEMAKTDIGMSVLKDASAAQQKAANKQPLTPYEKSALATITGIQTAPQDLWNGYLAQYGDDPAKARNAMIRDQIRVAQAGHQPSAATNAMWAIRADLQGRLGHAPTDPEVAQEYMRVFGRQGNAAYKPMNDATAAQVQEYYIQQVIQAHPEWKDFVYTPNPQTAMGKYQTFKPPEVISVGHWYGGADQRPAYQDFKTAVAGAIQADHDRNVSNGEPTYDPRRIAPRLFGTPPPTVANAPGAALARPEGAPAVKRTYTVVAPNGIRTEMALDPGELQAAQQGNPGFKFTPK